MLAQKPWTVTLESDIEPTEIITVRATSRYTALRRAQICLEERIGDRVEHYKVTRVRLGVSGEIFRALMLGYQTVIESQRRYDLERQ